MRWGSNKAKRLKVESRKNTLNEKRMHVFIENIIKTEFDRGTTG